MAIELTQDQRRQVVTEEAVYQLTIMIQYLNNRDKALYLGMINKYMPLIDREPFLKKHGLDNLEVIDGDIKWP